MEILRINKEVYSEWLLKKHYAKRLCSVSYAFGLYIDGCIRGVVTYGMPPSSTLASSICGKEYKQFVLELNRLVVDDGFGRNVLSWFVSNSIKMIDGDRIIVSFADANMSHNGYIYQATNFIYTGTSTNITMLVDKFGNEFHFRNIGHYQKNNKLNAKLIKRRLNEDKISRTDIANFLRKHRGEFKIKDLDSLFGYKDTASHWFRLDKGFSFPSVDDWVVLKDLFDLPDEYDDVMLNFKLVPCASDIINKLELKRVDILPKHRYVFFKGSKKFKSKCKRDLKLQVLSYPKGENRRYDSSYKPNIQQKLF